MSKERICDLCRKDIPRYTRPFAQFENIISICSDDNVHFDFTISVIHYEGQDPKPIDLCHECLVEQMSAAALNALR